MRLERLTRKFNICISHLCQNNEDLQKFIDRHERRQLVLDNLCREIQNYEQNYPRKYTWDHNSNDRRINEMVAQVAQQFFHAAKLQREQSLLSSAEKSRIQNEGQLKRDAEAIITEIDSPGEGAQAHERLIFSGEVS